MKNGAIWKKGLTAGVLALALTAGLSACTGPNGDSPEAVLAKAQENMAKVESMHYDMTMDMDMSFLGQTMSMSTNMDADFIVSPMTMKMDMNMNMGEMGNVATTSYMVQEGDDYIVYTGSDDGSGSTAWFKQTMSDMAQLEQYNAKANMDLYLSSSENFTKNGTETIEGMETTRYDGVITKEALDEVMESSGLMDQMGALGMGDVSSLLEEMEDLPISIWVDNESYLPVKYEMDMSAMMQKMMDKAMAAEGQGEMSLTVEKVFLSMVISQFDEIESIDIPQEALDSEELDMESMFGDEVPEEEVAEVEDAAS